jgi:hypothetical protein
MNFQRLKICGLVAAFCLSIFVVGIYDFLAINRPVAEANVLVVEGWLWSSSAMKEAAELYKQGKYDWLVTVGEPNDGNVQDEGEQADKSTAELAAKRLMEYSVDEKRITQLAVPQVEKHQTYACALTVRKWLNESKIKPTGINVFSLGTHARKSLVLFEKALGHGVKVGVYAGTEDTFDPNSWWSSSRGIYVVARKTLGYLYAVFWPLPNQG